MIYHDLIIVGGGASGLIAAIAAKDFGLDVAIVEANDRICKKLLSTGNGRCNISNTNIKKTFKNYHSENNNFYSNTLNNFTLENTKDLFLSLGLPFVELENNKLYPQSLQASSVIDIFRIILEEKQIPLYLNSKINNLTKKKLFSLSTTNDEYKNFSCKKLILSCGGNVAPKTGSDGSGYKLAKTLGHSIITPLPGIVQLKLNYPYLKALSGIKFEGSASLLVNNEIVCTEIGEILFTDYGISGPAILQLSSYASKALYNDCKVNLIIDMFYTISIKELKDALINHISMFNYREISQSLIGLINKKLIPIILKDSGIKDIHQPCNNIEWQYITNIIDKLKNWKFICTGTNGFNNAQVTVGGINTKEINPLTLESNLIKDLYFSGEIMDVHGDCGGFNLQWAWSSGYISAQSAAKSI